MKTLFFILAFSCSGHLFAQTKLEVGGNIEGSNVIMGNNNSVVNNIFGKSPEYGELKKRLEGLATAIAKKADKCGKYTDSLAKEDCRAELIALNAERDSVQKIEKRFREDVVRLAEGFSKMDLNSERLRLAKQLFDEGKIRDADNVLNAQEIKIEGDALLAEKAREQEKLQWTDSLLRIKADEFALKARLKVTDYGDSLRYDSAVIYFEESRRYAETVENFRAFAFLLDKHNETTHAIGYCETALKLARSESEEASLSASLGNFYQFVHKMAEAEKMYLLSLEIRERLAKVNPAEFEQDLASTMNSLGALYQVVHKMGDAEKMYLRSLEIFERLAKANPAELEPDLAMTAMNLGYFYKAVQKMAEAEKMYLLSLEIRERLAKANPAEFEPKLAMTAMNLGNFYKAIQKMAEAEKMYLLSLEIRERLAKANPAEFEPKLGLTCINFSELYIKNQRLEEAESFSLRSLNIFEHFSKQDPEKFEFYLAYSLNVTGQINMLQKEFAASMQYYNRSLTFFQKIMLAGQTYYKKDLDVVFSNTAALRDSFTRHHDYLSAVRIQRERVLCIETLCIVDSTYLQSGVSAYDTLARLCLFAHEYPEAQATTERALALDRTQNWVRINLGHSYLLRSEWSKAKAVYEEYLKNDPDPIKAKKTLAKDWDELEAAGITCPEMAKARAWLKG